MPTNTHLQLLAQSSSDVTKSLVDVLGAPLVAVIGGAKDTRSVRQWLSGSGPREAALTRLRTALQIVEILRRRFESDMVRAWFTGMNPLLDDKSPLIILADEDERSFPAVILAARRFTAEQ